MSDGFPTYHNLWKIVKYDIIEMLFVWTKVCKIYGSYKIKTLDETKNVRTTNIHINFEDDAVEINIFIICYLIIWHNLKIRWAFL